MKRLSICLMPAVLLLSLNGFAEKSSYFGVGYQMGTYDENYVPEATIGALQLSGGHYLNENFALEGQVSFGVSGDTVAVDVGIVDPMFDGMSVDVDVELKQAFSLFLKGDVNLGEAFNVYGLLGVTQAEIEGSAGGYDFSENDSGLSWGFGAEIVKSDWAFSAEYVVYLSQEAYDFTALNFAVSKFF